MRIADQIIEFGPFVAGGDIPGPLRYPTAQDMNQLRDELLAARRNAAELTAWRATHDAGGDFATAVEARQPALGHAVRVYRDSVQEALARQGFPIVQEGA